MSERHEKTLELLLEAGRVLSSKLELSELLTTVLELSARVVDAESASLLLLDPKTDELYFDVALGLGEEASKLRLKMGQGIAGAVAQNRRPEIINEVRKDGRWSPAMDAQSGFVTRSILAVPILLKGKLVGVVEAINKRGGVFDEEDLQHLEAFASQAGVAIENARLFTSLKEERFKLSTVFAQMANAAVLTDEAGKVLLANEAAGRLLGAELPDIARGLTGMAVTPSLNEVLASDKPAADFAAVRNEPTLLVLEGRATRAPLGEGREGRLFVLADRTEAWRQEKLKRTFLSLISHKLRTPLAAITGFADILGGEIDAAEQPMAAKAVKTIQTQGAKVSELVDKLLRYTMLESPDLQIRPEPVPLDEAVGEAVRGLKDAIETKRARVDAPPSGLTVLADKGMLIEVIRNLVDNAVKFSGRPEAPVAVRATAEGEWAAISIADAGPGIPPEDHEKVFSRFHQVEKDFTGQQDGMGLGLAYARKVAQLHGGAVTLTSRLGEGTTVTVTIPRRRPA